jgi:PBP1b-binding outer membrane lipoprotein LpoB
MRSSQLACAVALAVIIIGGCKSSSSSSSGDGSSSQGRSQADAGALSGADLDRAVAEFAGKVEQLAARGWPAEVRGSDGKPRVVIEHMMNMSMGHIDMDELKRRVAQALTADGSVVVVDRDRDEAEMADRERQEMGMTPEGQEMQQTGTEERTSYVVGGRINEERLAAEGTRTSRYTVELMLTNTTNGRVQVQTRTEIVKTSEEE